MRVAFERFVMSAGGDVEHLDEAIGRGRGQVSAVGREFETKDRIAVRLGQCADQRRRRRSRTSTRRCAKVRRRRWRAACRRAERQRDHAIDQRARVVRRCQSSARGVQAGAGFQKVAAPSVPPETRVPLAVKATEATGALLSKTSTGAPESVVQVRTSWLSPAEAEFACRRPSRPGADRFFGGRGGLLGGFGRGLDLGQRALRVGQVCSCQRDVVHGFLDADDRGGRGLFGRHVGGSAAVASPVALVSAAAAS